MNNFENIFDLSCVTLQDCLSMYRDDYIVEVNDGCVVNFKKEQK